jgi:hypothetical protein
VIARSSRHCEKRHDEAIQKTSRLLDCVASLAMTVAGIVSYTEIGRARLRTSPQSL